MVPEILVVGAALHETLHQEARTQLGIVASTANPSHKNYISIVHVTSRLDYMAVLTIFSSHILFIIIRDRTFLA